MMLNPGTYLQGRYEILSLIGTGGMSEVYQAKCHTLNRLVAIKVLKEEYSEDLNFVSKFKMEAQAAAGLSHPNIVGIYDVVDEGELHYIVMELIEGITLKSYIAKKGHLGVRETIGISIQVAQGIAAAHDQHIVHRDVKPQNMIISRDGKVKVADFGIARAVSAQTVGTNAVGSVHYISPEQARGGYSDARSDIYSLGITMFEMVTGHLPFDGDNAVSIALAHLEEPILSPKYLNPEVTPSLERIIMKCTNKKPERRYQDAYELVADLRHALVDPDDAYLAKEPETDDNSTTVIHDREDLSMLLDKQKSYQPKGTPIQEENVREYKSKTARRKQTHEDVNPQMERLMTTVGIVAAVIIVAVVIVIFTKLGGIFNSGSPGKPQVQTETAQEQLNVSGTESRVPKLLGLTEDQAKAALEQASLKIHYEYRESEEEQKGMVIEQNIPADTVVSKQSEIVVTIGQGHGKTDLSSLGLEEMTEDEARAALTAHDVWVQAVEEASDTIEEGRVLRYEPVNAAPGDTVTLYVSSGPQLPMVPVPDIKGMSEENAKIVLDTMGFTLGERTEEKSEEAERGIIIAQEIEPKTETPEGTAINYTVSAGRGTKYVAVVNEEYPLSEMFGPSSGDAHIEVSIVMIQTVDGQPVEKVILEPRVMGGNITIPIHYHIEGAFGVLTGELQVLDLTNNRILKTYPLEFLEVDI